MVYGRLVGADFPMAVVSRPKLIGDAHSLSCSRYRRRGRATREPLSRRSGCHLFFNDWHTNRDRRHRLVWCFVCLFVFFLLGVSQGLTLGVIGFWWVKEAERGGGGGAYETLETLWPPRYTSLRDDNVNYPAAGGTDKKIIIIIIIRGTALKIVFGTRARYVTFGTALRDEMPIEHDATQGENRIGRFHWKSSVFIFGFRFVLPVLFHFAGADWPIKAGAVR